MLVGIFQTNFGFAPPRVSQRVERFHALYFVDRANLQMVLQVGPHTRRVYHHRHPALLQLGGRADARELQNLRATDAACAQNHLGVGQGGDHLVAVPHLHARASLAAIFGFLDDQTRYLGCVPQFKVRPSVALWPQECFGRVPSETIFLVDFKIAHALVVATVKVCGGGYACLRGGLGKSIQNIPAQALFFNAPFATYTAVYQAFAASLLFTGILGMKTAVVQVFIA